MIATWVTGFALSRGVLAIDLFLTVSLLLTTRFVMRALHHFRSVQDKNAQRAVIYGADAGGVRVIRELLEHPLHQIRPVGFIDDNPRNLHKTVRGYPVFGTSEDLETIIKEEEVDAVIVEPESIQAEVLVRMKAVCKDADVRMQRLRVELTEVEFSARR